MDVSYPLVIQLRVTVTSEQEKDFVLDEMEELLPTLAENDIRYTFTYPRERE